jgi:hypothetical protein
MRGTTPHRAPRRMRSHLSARLARRVRLQILLLRPVAAGTRHVVTARARIGNDFRRYGNARHTQAQATAHDLQFTSCQFACGVLRPRTLATYDIAHRPSPDKVFEQASAIQTSHSDFATRSAFRMALPTTFDGPIRAASVAGVPPGRLT